MTTSDSSGVIYTDFNYETLRNNNLQQVQDYYSKVLEVYTSQYNQYLAKSTSNNQADKDQAIYMASEGSLPKVNQHLMDVIGQFNSTIEQDIGNLKEQQKQVEIDTQLTLDNQKAIDDLNILLGAKATDLNKNTSSMNDTHEANRENLWWQWFFVLFNLVLFIAIIYLIYKVMSSSSGSYNNNRSKNI